VSGYTSVTSTRLSPHSTQLSISSIMNSGPWLSSYNLDVLDDKDVDLTPADSEMDAVGDITICSLYADDPDLAHFVSVADLQRSPGASAIDFSLFCLGMPTGGTDFKAHRAACLPLSFSSPSPIPPPALGRPVRDSHINMVDLPLKSDVIFMGILSSSFVKAVVPSLYTLGPVDYRFSWVQDSHFCSGGEKNLFFSVLSGHTLPRGYPYQVYSGRDTKILHLFYPQAPIRFVNSDYILYLLAIYFFLLAAPARVTL
jgi:hypothetical protein